MIDQSKIDYIKSITGKTNNFDVCDLNKFMKCCFNAKIYHSLNDLAQSENYPRCGDDWNDVCAFTDGCITLKDYVCYHISDKKFFDADDVSVDYFVSYDKEGNIKEMFADSGLVKEKCLIEYIFENSK